MAASIDLRIEEQCHLFSFLLNVSTKLWVLKLCMSRLSSGTSYLQLEVSAGSFSLPWSKLEKQTLIHFEVDEF